jgi:hypothetical protein
MFMVGAKNSLMSQLTFHTNLMVAAHEGRAALIVDTKRPVRRNNDSRLPLRLSYIFPPLPAMLWAGIIVLAYRLPHYPLHLP